MNYLLWILCDLFPYTVRRSPRTTSIKALYIWPSNLWASMDEELKMCLEGVDQDTDSWISDLSRKEEKSEN